MSFNHADVVDTFPDILQALQMTFHSGRNLGQWFLQQLRSYHLVQSVSGGEQITPVLLESLETEFLDHSLFPSLQDQKLFYWSRILQDSCHSRGFAHVKELRHNWKFKCTISWFGGGGGGGAFLCPATVNARKVRVPVVLLVIFISTGLFMATCQGRPQTAKANLPAIAFQVAAGIAQEEGQKKRLAPPIESGLGSQVGDYTTFKTAVDLQKRELCANAHYTSTVPVSAALVLFALVATAPV
ncbi:unnamed protein product [Cyprideis torosa]|uniref:Uncharacterized protein n=1 Tax=Cyprideis torosa TaxID=163714 RepID=A0A7R8WBG1_9CRUS|nr:unnamed protein product [Cyprideis torosa]CAG0886265.1 unnamed protein product [Cyprideis torosa]